ncbi:hypothetical protein C8F04DRAFT_1151712 [Mycena alexandri]|uniref:Uncharacterized protein n=1 Tax=Mycena alexandri TaxID=1745969 RepID=A0AAD6S160_9AGAR|nr:hypothetical protein C8F04DRAFT_1151712 [Mycena alexandri]
MRLSQASQENPWTVPGVNGAATVPTHIRVSAGRTSPSRSGNKMLPQQEFDRLQSQLVQNHNSLDSLPIIGASSAASQTVVASIARVKFAQDAAVLAYLVAHWIDPTDSSIKMKELGPYKAVGTRQEFNLVDEGLPDGATVRFSSYVVGVGEYENDLWFKIDGPFIAHDDFQVGAISHVKYVQNAAVSAYLLVRWIDPSDGITRSKDLGPWKAIATRENLSWRTKKSRRDHRDIVFKVDNSASQGAMFTQTGTAFQGFFTFEGLSLTSSVEDTKN